MQCKQTRPGSRLKGPEGLLSARGSLPFTLILRPACPVEQKALHTRTRTHARTLCGFCGFPHGFSLHFPGEHSRRACFRSRKLSARPRPVIPAGVVTGFGEVGPRVLPNMPITVRCAGLRRRTCSRISPVSLLGCREEEGGKSSERKLTAPVLGAWS